MYHVSEQIQDFLREEIDRAGYKEVIIGLSGGIDSALAAKLVADAFRGSSIDGQEKLRFPLCDVRLADRSLTLNSTLSEKDFANWENESKERHTRYYGG